eukprot:354809-Pelagomonas_calceolata.AAC.9
MSTPPLTSPGLACPNPFYTNTAALGSSRDPSFPSACMCFLVQQGRVFKCCREVAAGRGGLLKGRPVEGRWGALVRS